MIGVFVQLNEDSPSGRRLPVGYVIQENGCWTWVGCMHEEGYGRVGAHTGATRAHRYVYEMARGTIPAGLQLDHLCRNRACVNPDHLEPVTREENIMRGAGRGAANAAKTHCHRGHELAGENLAPRPAGAKRRECRVCAKERRIKWQAANRGRLRAYAARRRAAMRARKVAA